jgi:hypothetical protein
MESHHASMAGCNAKPPELRFPLSSVIHKCTQSFLGMIIHVSLLFYTEVRSILLLWLPAATPALTSSSSPLAKFHLGILFSPIRRTKNHCYLQYLYVRGRKFGLCCLHEILSNLAGKVLQETVSLTWLMYVHRHFVSSAMLHTYICWVHLQL